MEYESLGPRVRCFDSAAQPRDVPYQVLQASRGRPGRRFGFAWADQWQPETLPGLGAGLSVFVICANQSGQPVDSRFNVMVIE